MPELTVRDHMTLCLAAATYRYPAARESDAFDQVGMSAPIFWRHVNRLLDSPAALAEYPVEVNRLRRLREARRRTRSDRRVA